MFTMMFCSRTTMNLVKTTHDRHDQCFLTHFEEQKWLSNSPAVAQNLLLQFRRKLCFTLLKIGGLSKLLNASSSQTLKKTVVTMNLLTS